jgi:hypothetical protein
MRPHLGADQLPRLDETDDMRAGHPEAFGDLLGRQRQRHAADGGGLTFSRQTQNGEDLRMQSLGDKNGAALPYLDTD